MLPSLYLGLRIVYCKDAEKYTDQRISSDSLIVYVEFVYRHEITIVTIPSW